MTDHHNALTLVVLADVIQQTLDIVTGEPRTIRDGSVVALNNSFGFGGHNVALAFRSL